MLGRLRIRPHYRIALLRQLETISKDAHRSDRRSRSRTLHNERTRGVPFGVEGDYVVGTTKGSSEGVRHWISGKAAQGSAG
jgi:hypothetical protein